MFNNSGNDKLTIKPMDDARLLVNGQFTTGETELKHNQRVVIGHGNAFKVIIPKKADEAPEEDESLGAYGSVMSDRLNSDNPLTNNIKRFLNDLDHRCGREMMQKFSAIFAQALDTLDEVNEITKYRYEKFPKPENNVYFTLEVMIDILDYEEDEPELAVRCRDKVTDEVLFLWPFEKLLQRLTMMQDWYDDMEDDGILNRERFCDPWLDISEEAVDDNKEQQILE